MSEAADRLWKVRDAVMTYLYEAYAADRQVPSIDPATLGAAVGWRDSDITDGEVKRALTYLVDKDYVKGFAAYGSGLLRPYITSRGQDFVGRGLSVQGTAEGPQAMPSSVVINASGNTNVSVGSNHVTQSIESGDVAIEKARGVATALEKAAAGEGVSVEAATEARELAAEIQVATDEEEPDKGRILGLMGKVITMANQFAGSELANLAVDVIPMLTS